VIARCVEYSGSSGRREFKQRAGHGGDPESRQPRRALVASVTAEDWQDLANWLGRLVSWEYAYKYDRDRGVVVSIDQMYPQFRRDQSGS
jgi:hypothetical protein